MNRIGDLECKIADIEQRLAALDAERARLASELDVLRDQLRESKKRTSIATAFLNALVTNASPADSKIALIRKLFKGRDDVYAKRWESPKIGKSGYQPACRNEWAGGLCDKRRVKCADCPNREFLPLTDSALRSHFAGHERPGDVNSRDFVIGIYPMLADETCWFLAADFDKASWQEDAAAFMETCKLHGVPVGLERSRSGNGGHVWAFFAEPVPASLARQLGTFLVTDTMKRRPEIGFDSYDRFFPNQDTLPKGGFGNLIALPFQGAARKQSNTLFLDEHFVPYADQWAFLSSLQPMSRVQLMGIVEQAQKRGEITGVRMVVTDEDEDEPCLWPGGEGGGLVLLSQRKAGVPIQGKMCRQTHYISSRSRRRGASSQHAP